MCNSEIIEFAELGSDTELNLALRSVVAWSWHIDIQR